MLLSDGSQEFGKNLRMFCRHIMVFVDIGSQIIEPRLAFYYHQFPVTLSHANLVGFVKFPVQVIVMFLLCILAQKGRSDRDSVETITSQLSVGITLGKVSDASQIAESRQQVVKGKLGIVHRSCLDMLRPPGDKWYADAAFVALAFQTFQLTVATEELRVGTTFFMWSVI